MFSEHPLQGVGLGMYEYYSGLYQKSEKSIAKFGKLARTAHNQFLHLGAELGSFGLGAYLIFLVLILRKLKKSKKSFYIKAALSAIILFSFFHNILFHLPTAVMGIYLSILLTEDVECRSKSFPVKKRFILYPLLLGGLMLFSLTKPMAAFFFFRKGVNYEEQGDVRKAKVFYQKALRWDKRCSEYWGEFGEFCFDIYKLTQQLLWLIEAERNYAVALSLSPRNASYFSRWGMICFELYIKRRSQAFLNKATFCFTQAQKLIPTNAFYYFNLALTARAKGEIRKAKELLKRALQLEPNFIGAYGFLSALTRKDNPKQALKYSRKAEIRLKNITNKPISEYERALLRPYGSSEKDKN
jgi:tetratricopeptide (TPR) repeat protein